MSERQTENAVLTGLGVKLGRNGTVNVLEQGETGKISLLEELLRLAGGKPSKCDLYDYSRRGTGKARPEYIITFDDKPDTIIVIECKKKVSMHESSNKNQPKSFAVDGVLYYAKFLKSEYNVIAIAASGIKTLKVTAFEWRKGQSEPHELARSKDVLYTPENYLRLVAGQSVRRAVSLEDIRNLALKMHDSLRVLKVAEQNKPIFIAGILIALKDEAFVKEYTAATTFKSLLSRLQAAIDAVIKDSDIKLEKRDEIRHSFDIIGLNGKISDIPLGEDNSLLWYISELDKKIKPMLDYADSSLDALGIFYHEFVKYSGGDGKGLGIVLTPQHLTEFMVEVTGISKNSKVVDICCGSGAFLVSAMATMYRSEGVTDTDIFRIRNESLFGVEFDNSIYTLAIANMIVRGDGKSNILYGDCFNKRIIEELKNKHINVGLINPPYSQEDHSELEFTELLLDILTAGGTGAAVLPMSCAIGTKHAEVRERLFKKHTLKAVFSMPDDIFYSNNSSVNVCVMVWEAHTPHNSEKPTFFGYYKDDGFVKAKKLGRIDKFNRWEDIKREWLHLYQERETKEGMTAKKGVTWKDEWLCEAYMETDYSKIKQDDFEQTVRNYFAYLVKAGKRK
jgi:type I restriction-modification system DNA methylase subunit